MAAAATSVTNIPAQQQSGAKPETQAMATDKKLCAIYFEKGFCRAGKHCKDQHLNPGKLYTQVAEKDKTIAQMQTALEQQANQIAIAETANVQLLEELSCANENYEESMTENQKLKEQLVAAQKANAALQLAMSKLEGSQMAMFLALGLHSNQSN